METNRYKVSIIVPFYNVEKYIKKCFESLVKQSYENIEIIAVNDGSVDSSEKEIESIIEKDSRFVLLKKENGGLSDARNYGFKYATGDYIVFVDSDDYVEPNYIEVLLRNAIDKNADISVCNYYYTYNDSNKVAVCSDIPSVIDCASDAIKNLYLFDGYGVGVWNKMFKRSILWDNLFPVGKLSEDYYVMYQIFSKASIVVYSSSPLYHYVQRPNSITKNKAVKMFVIDSGLQFRDFCQEYYPELIRVANTNLVFQAIAMYNTGRIHGSLTTEKRNELDRIFNTYSKDIDNSIIPISRKIQLYLYSRSRPVYDFAFILFKTIRLRFAGR